MNQYITFHSNEYFLDLPKFLMGWKFGRFFFHTNQHVYDTSYWMLGQEGKQKKLIALYTMFFFGSLIPLVPHDNTKNNQTKLRFRFHIKFYIRPTPFSFTKYVKLRTGFTYLKNLNESVQFDEIKLLLNWKSCYVYGAAYCINFECFYKLIFIFSLLTNIVNITLRLLDCRKVAYQKKKQETI